MKHYDLIVIGAGSGNSIPSHHFDDLSIAIVEKAKFGGTCLNVGCIPTKMFVYAADIAREIQDAAKYGLEASLQAVDWPAIVDRIFIQRIDPIAQSGEEYRKGPETPNIDVYSEHARFVDTRTLQVGTERISADRIVIATGARPSIPKVIAESGVTYYTNENILRLPQLPKSMIIQGGGFIAAEFAHVFSSLGVEVTVTNRSPLLLRKADETISQRFTEIAATKWNLQLGHEVTAAAETPNGIELTLDNGEVLHGEILLVATGRTPNGDQMDLHLAGIEMDGPRIKIDEFGRTTAEGVWALGDVSSPYQLKHVANAEMRAVRHNLAYPDDLQPMPHDHVPSAIFTNPQLASVGMTEAEARNSGRELTIKIQNYSDTAYGWAMEDTTGFMKVIADRNTGQLLGVHVLGPQASTLIQQLVTVMAFDLDVREVARNQYWIHPALPEVTENALLGLEFA